MAVAALTQDRANSPERMNLVDALADQTASAIERAQATTAARETDLKLRTEEIRTGLLSAVSHDLRTPLASITGAASGLLSQGDQLDASTRRELIESIESEAERLSRLVNNLLEMTRLESGSVEVRRELFPLEELVGSSLGRLEKTLSGREIATRIPEGLPPLYVDGILFEQVLLNVLENVAKYTPAGSPVEIAAAEDRGGVRIEIADRGPGFAEGEERRIWEKFYRGKAAGARGAGLGLAISRAIVTAHTGTISAENRPDGGAVVRIWIPSRSSDA
jgi:two-component system sensor histidine kinase KdpD